MLQDESFRRTSRCSYWKKLLSEKDRNVIDISATDSSFAALKNDGSVVAWGLAYNLTYDHSTKWDLNSLLDKEVSTIVSSSNSFAALQYGQYSDE